MPPVSRTERATEAWEALFRAQVAVMRHLAADDVWDELSLREYDVLFTLSRAPGRRLRLHDLNREILLSQPSLSRLVERLVVAGLVTREGDPGDRRGTVVALTDEGARRQQSVGRRHAASIRRHVGPALSDDELDTLTDLCTKLRGAQD
ncbi:MarR family winged helix-turn-helix transcriptional regulator [Rhodococcus jostii]|uniref:DNA-binding transcriptional regulator, MarR family n=1 Tax=Rhodococcus jostii TaxID=132919 RepID=A0A1H4XJ81_RHOJO|nr:MarR family winged helix-turn-helix transcriptional regulator [Rhodococcus jostii]SED05666.1 DNA-binding transcriptional regulator, MarR family [Rhodococcus jostii]